MSDTSSPAKVNALCGTLLALAVVTIALRFYTRTVQKLSLGIDDWVMVPCVVRFTDLVTSRDGASLITDPRFSTLVHV